MRKTRQSKEKMTNEDGDGESSAQTIDNPQSDGEKEGEGDGVGDPARVPDGGAGETNATPEVDRLNLMPEDDESILEDGDETEEGRMMASGNPMIGGDPPLDDEEEERLLMIDEGGNDADEGVEGDEKITGGASSDSELFGNCLNGVDEFDENNHSACVDAAGETPADEGLQQEETIPRRDENLKSMDTDTDTDDSVVDPEKCKVKIQNRNRKDKRAEVAKEVKEREREEKMNRRARRREKKQKKRERRHKQEEMIDNANNAAEAADRLKQLRQPKWLRQLKEEEFVKLLMMRKRIRPPLMSTCPENHMEAPRRTETGHGEKE